MSEINKTSQQSLQRILDKIGVKSANEKKEEVKLKRILKENKINSIYIPFEVALKTSAAHILNLGWQKENKLFLISNYDTLNIGNSLYFFGLILLYRYNLVLKHQIQDSIL